MRSDLRIALATLLTWGIAGSTAVADDTDLSQSLLEIWNREYEPAEEGSDVEFDSQFQIEYEVPRVPAAPGARSLTPNLDRLMQRYGAHPEGWQPLDIGAAPAARTPVAYTFPGDTQTYKGTTIAGGKGGKKGGKRGGRGGGGGGGGGGGDGGDCPTPPPGTPPTPTPEPASALLLGLGAAAGAGLRAYRRRRA